MLSLLIRNSYALYQRNIELTFINTKWSKANEISYTTKTNTEITNVEQVLNELYKKLGE